MRRLLPFSLLCLAACAGGPGGGQAFVPQPGQGAYIRPPYLDAQPTPRVPPPDICRSQFYQMLVSQHEGALFIAGLPGRKRVIKPAETEDFDRDFIEGISASPPLLEVRDYLADQTLYAPSISVRDPSAVFNEDEARLTLQLDAEGYVQQVRCG